MSTASRTPTPMTLTGSVCRIEMSADADTSSATGITTSIAR